MKEIPTPQFVSVFNFEFDVPAIILKQDAVTVADEVDNGILIISPIIVSS